VNGTSDRDRVLHRAFELSAEDEAEQQEELEGQRLRVAAQEVGLDPAYLTRAEQDLEQQARRRKKARRAVFIAAASLLTAVGLAAGAVRVFVPPAPEPWVQSFDRAGAWSLDVNPGTRSELRYETESGRGQVAIVQVSQFATAGEPRAELRTSAIPNDVSRYDQLRLDLKGTLPAARIQLEASRTERWVSAPLPATSQWTTHRLELQDFQHQVYEGGRWMSIDDKAPESISRLSISVGEGASGAGATGTLSLDNLKLE
jgi:hypothetical protein